jgi:hypothetical protein
MTRPPNQILSIVEALVNVTMKGRLHALLYADLFVGYMKFTQT